MTKAKELVASELRYRNLFERNPLPMWVYDVATLRVLTVNDAAIRHLGFSREEFAAMTVVDLRPEDERPRLLEEVRALAGYHVSGRWKLLKKDGTIVVVEILSHEMPFAERPARLVSAVDVTARVEAEEKLRRSYDELRELSARLETVREEEATRIAREVHDEVGQALTALKLDVGGIERALAAAGGAPLAVAERLRAADRLLGETMDVVQRISTELRPGVLDQLGLDEAVEWQVEEFRRRTGLACAYESALSGIAVDARRSTAVFRVLQELLTNVVRHAAATRVDVRLSASSDGGVLLVVEDDGRGIAAKDADAPTAFGLRGVRERVAHVGGRVEVAARPEGGTRARVEVPL